MNQPSYRETLIQQRKMLEIQLSKIHRIIQVLDNHPEFEELIKLIQEQK